MKRKNVEAITTPLAAKVHDLEVKANDLEQDLIERIADMEKRIALVEKGAVDSLGLLVVPGKRNETP